MTPVGNIPPELQIIAYRLLDATCNGAPLMILDSINSVNFNVYLRPGGKSDLGPHFDSGHIFKRPVYTLRLFSAAKLIFCTGGMQAPNGPYMLDVDRGFPVYFEVPLERGCLTEMSGFSALEDCIKRIPGDMIKFNLKDWGVSRSDLDNLARESFTKGRIDNNIVDLSYHDIKLILTESFSC